MVQKLYETRRKIYANGTTFHMVGVGVKSVDGNELHKMVAGSGPVFIAETPEQKHTLLRNITSAVCTAPRKYKKTVYFYVKKV